MGAAGARILVVEDDPELASLSMGVLERAGYEVMVAHTGAEGIRISREHLPDLTLLDFELPDMDAIEVLDLIRDGAERTPSPVLILTGARQGRVTRFAASSTAPPTTWPRASTVRSSWPASRPRCASTAARTARSAGELS